MWNTEIAKRNISVHFSRLKKQHNNFKIL